MTSSDTIAAVTNFERDSMISDLAANVSITDGNDLQGSHRDEVSIPFPSDIPVDTRHSLQQYNSLVKSHSQALMLDRAMEAQNLKGAIEELASGLMVRLDRGDAHHQLILRALQAADERQVDMLSKLDEAKKARHEALAQLKVANERLVRVDKKQDMVLDRLVIIQNRVKAVLTQTYELHEYPIPRLFIVLPKTPRRRDNIVRPFSKQFRLYFLCECGKHTMVEGRNIPHEIHMAKHEGYDLDRPTEFFEKYGSYVVTVMQMIRYGLTVAGIIVPALTNFKLAEGLEIAEKGLEFTNQTFSTIMDETISYIEEQKGRDKGGIDALEERTTLDKQEILEGAELRQLATYLAVKDEERVLGNLYRIVTLEGHVKWVCQEHYSENYQQANIQKLIDMIEVNSGLIDQKEGNVSIILQSRVTAQQFYAALTAARGIQKLTITLQWDATHDDLRAFKDAITKANILSLSMNGKWLKGPSTDIINRGRRFDPLLELMCNGRIQSLALHDFHDFYKRISAPPPTAASSRIRALLIESDADMMLLGLDMTAKKRINTILRCCPLLTELTLQGLHVAAHFTHVLEAVSDSEHLRRLRMASQGFSVFVGLSEGRVEAMEADVEKQHFLLNDRISFLQKGCVFKLGPTNYDDVTKLIFDSLDGLNIRNALHLHPANRHHRNQTAENDNLLTASDLGRQLHLNRLLKAPFLDLRTVILRYLIVPCGIYFSEKEAASFQEFISKYAMHVSHAHADAADVMFSGEFRLFRDEYHHDDWTLLIDNNSGMYATKKEKLFMVKKVFEHHFPDLVVVALDREDPYLKEIRSETKRIEAEVAAQQKQRFQLFSSMSSQNE
ncbi:hypothetical protein BGZ75_010364 [Mortierella antarctica]|nr:hypothetical protein BGZ75_010364 [Mortierella antarctica]